MQVLHTVGISSHGVHPKAVPKIWIPLSKANPDFLDCLILRTDLDFFGI